MRRPAIGFPHLMSTAAVFCALSGTATAAALITGAAIKDESVTGADIKNGSLKSADFGRGQLPAGPKGATGPAGPGGAAGPGGSAGATGPAGLVGPAGPGGSAGAPGLAGPAGPGGAAGASGPAGATGPAGPQGEAGPNGAAGPAGTAGLQGPKGDDGTPGATGPAGPAGAQGPQGPAGPPGPAGGTVPIKPPVGLLSLTGVSSERADGAIVVSKIDWAAEADTSWQRGAGASVGKPTIAALTFTKPADTTSPALWQKISTGKGFASGSLKLTADATAAPYATIALGQMFVTSIEPRTEGGKRVEDVSLVVDPLAGGVVTVPPPVLATGPPPTLDDPVGTLKITGFTGSRPISFVKGGVQAASSFSAGGVSVGKPFFAPLSLRKGVDGQSLVFRDLISQGRSMTEVTIDVPGSSTTPHVVYELEDVFVSEISLEGTGGSIEKVGLTPKVIRILTTVGTGPTTTFCFDVPAGRVC